MIEVDFYCEGKYLGQATTDVYPHYQKGDTLEITSPPSARDLARRPAQEAKSGFFTIVKVHHIIDELQPMAFTYKIDVLLERERDPDHESEVMAMRRDRRKKLDY